MIFIWKILHQQSYEIYPFVENYPSVIKLSKETSPSNNNLKGRSLTRVIPTSYFHVMTDAPSFFKYFFTSVINYNVFRFLVNIFSIFSRLFILYYLCRIFLCCIRISLNICYMFLYFIFFFVLAYCYKTYFDDCILFMIVGVHMQ